MFDAAGFRELVSGRRQGIRAAAMRSALRLAESPYAFAMQWRNARYDRGRAEIHRVDVPVISVGNITLGGTGKTPMVEWLSRWFREKRVRVALVSRGYKAEAGARNDEALELEEKLPDVPHVQDADRVAASRLAIEEFESQLILLDDGFQHRRLHRDLDLVLVDALEPFGFDHVFPRGMLREPLSGLRRADLICLTRASAVPPDTRDAIRKRLERWVARERLVEFHARPASFRNAAGDSQPIGPWSGKRVAAFCGIGNPAGFARTLKEADLDCRSLREFPDHHLYTRPDIESLASWVRSEHPDADAVVCTHKDLVKVGLAQIAGRPLFALTLELEVVRGGESLTDRLNGILKRIDSTPHDEA